MGSLDCGVLCLSLEPDPFLLPAHTFPAMTEVQVGVVLFWQNSSKEAKRRGGRGSNSSPSMHACGSSGAESRETAKRLRGPGSSGFR